MGQETIAIIEDEPDILEILEYNLSREGFKVLSSQNGDEGLDLVRRETPDLLLLDLMLPGTNGLEICRQLKTDEDTKAIPIIMLTAKSEESDVVLGLGLGADDYICKPFSPRELVARIQAVLRRGPVKVEDKKEEQRLVREGLVVDSMRHQVFVDGEEAPLTATEFRLLGFMMSHPGRVFTREQLVMRAIGQDAVVIDRNIDVHIRAIRKKIGSYRGLIETVRGVGYRFQE